MNILAWSINHGDNNIEDFFTLHSTQADAQEALQQVQEQESDLYCWAITDVLDASEPHWTEKGF